MTLTFRRVFLKGLYMKTMKRLWDVIKSTHWFWFCNQLQNCKLKLHLTKPVFPVWICINMSKLTQYQWLHYNDAIVKKKKNRSDCFFTITACCNNTKTQSEFSQQLDCNAYCFIAEVLKQKCSQQEHKVFNYTLFVLWQKWLQFSVWSGQYQYPKLNSVSRTASLTQWGAS